MSVTYKPKRKKRARTHGFLTRGKTSGGKNILKRRRRKGRAQIAVKTRRSS
jgi:large subunit ribosomal protein L34